MKHITVLLNEAVEGLGTEQAQDGIYIDCTFGRGGHTKLLLEKLGPNAKVLGIDKDPRAIETANLLAKEDSRFEIAHASFADLKDLCVQKGWVGKVNGILMDLGVSSPQLDDADRGFSFMNDGPLDMRMDITRGPSAKEWINSAPEKEIATVLFTYGEERWGNQMANAIVKRRAETPFDRTLDLAEVIKQANRKWEKHKHPATRAFQAIRIKINKELEDLENVLVDVQECLVPTGRLSVISFHSLEDRIVKRYMKKQVKGDDIPIDIPVTADQLNQKMKLVGKKIKASKDEVQENPRSRSAVLRVAEKL